MISLSTEHSDYDNAVAVSAPCKIIVFYDDIRSRERVLKLSDHLVPQFWEDFEFEISWWKVNFMANPLFHEAIIKELKGADIVVFSLAPDFQMTHETKESMEFLMGFHINSQGLLVMALSKNYGPVNQYVDIHNFLESLAKRNRLDFLSEWQFEMENDQTDKASKQIGMPDAMPPTEGQHWGINE